MNDRTLPAARPQELPRRSTDHRRRINRVFSIVCVITALLSLVVLAVLLSAILVQGMKYLGTSFLVAPPHPKPAEAGIGPSLLGSLWVCVVCALLTLPVGVASAIVLEEFKPRNSALRWLHGFLQLNIANLAGVPSVVYGIIGLSAFVALFGLLGTTADPAFEMGANYYDQFLTEGDLVVLIPVAGPNDDESTLTQGMQAQTVRGKKVALNIIQPGAPYPDDPELLRRSLYSDAEPGRVSDKAWYYLRLPLGRGVLAGALTLMLVVLPIVIISSQEALRAVPDSLRAGALGMGATRWQVVWNITLPAAVPGIMTGTILAMSRAIGEAAPILMIAGTIYIASGPGHLMDDFSVMPLQIYTWAQRPQAEFHSLAASGIIVLLSLLLVFNTVAVVIRQKMQKQLS